MDMVTLAMAKAYTDKKLGEVEPGGGGSQGEVVIDIGDFDIDIISLIGAGGGTAQFTGTAPMWMQIDENRDFILTSIAYNGARVYMRPNYISEYEGMINYVAAQAFIDMGSGTIVTASIILYGYHNGIRYDGRTDVTVLVEMSHVPG